MKKLIALVVLLVMISGVACADMDRGEKYPRLTIITDINVITPEFCIVTCVDMRGGEWTFFCEEGDWMEGDLANLLMWNMGEEEENDEIIEIYYEGNIYE